NLNPDHPYVGKMARYLTQARGKDGKYRTTQEAAFALMALTEVVRVREKAAPNFQGRALLAGKPVAEAEFRGRSLEVRRTVLPMPQLPAIGAKSAVALVR